MSSKGGGLRQDPQARVPATVCSASQRCQMLCGTPTRRHHLPQPLQPTINCSGAVMPWSRSLA